MRQTYVDNGGLGEVFACCPYSGSDRYFLGCPWQCECAYTEGKLPPRYPLPAVVEIDGTYPTTDCTDPCYLCWYYSLM